jgi:hypothetical protein
MELHLSEETIGFCRKHKREDAPLFVYVYVEHDESTTVEDPANEWPAVVGLRFGTDTASWSQQLAQFVVKHETHQEEELALEEEIARDAIVNYEKHRHQVDEAVRFLNKIGIAAVRAP